MRDVEGQAEESPYVRLARNTVELFAREGRLFRPDFPLPPEMTDREAGVFVSIKKHGNLRGCIGTIGPTQGSVAAEISCNAISASTRDPRFEPIGPEELPHLTYSVDVLEPPEPVTGADRLDPKKYGVIVTLGRRRGLLLPDLEGVDTVEDQIGIAMGKAGIPPGDRDRVSLERFLVTRYY
ncbi:MAG: AmmeMemoRadiSam system protein A [Spirochaetaceae bacterium]|jgi:AmmeMemoRadiSam system protein A|nr:AmmeMemoRadiSam system protein A [Spirochaetaceae bacterium]